jgi:hypothetical protein
MLVLLLSLLAVPPSVFSIVQPQPAAWLDGWVVARPAAGWAGWVAGPEGWVVCQFSEDGRGPVTVRTALRP